MCDYFSKVSPANQEPERQVNIVVFDLKSWDSIPTLFISSIENIVNITFGYTEDFFTPASLVAVDNAIA